jgi:filamentous hemagglutinin family protein
MKNNRGDQSFGQNAVKSTKTASARVTSLMAGVSPIVLGSLFAVVPPEMTWAQAVNLDGLAVNNIVADGRTKTRISTTGNHTKISTETVSAGVGFNTFSDFQEAAGQRVDLFVPDQAGSLVNIVSNGAVVINGELNAFKDGKIGGNVYFANSNGFIVGKTGKVNVGSLTVNTPTQEFLNKIVRADGTVNNAVAAQLMRGEIPMSPNGVISISGEVNAEGGITLQGQTIFVNANTGPLTGADIGQRLKFNATVNSTGMIEGGALVSRGGQIAIVAAGDVSFGGRADVRAKSAGNGGKISVKSGGDTTIFATAEFLADGMGDGASGGEIIVQAGKTLLTEDQAKFSSAGVGYGDGGFVELSGKTAYIGAVQVNLATGSGAAGTLLFDPFDLQIGGVVTQSGASDDFSLAANIVSAGANIILQADNSITIAAGGILDSTNGGGAAGSITIEAPTITLANGSKVTAGTTGDVTMTAVRTNGGTAEIIIGQGTGTAPILSGANITLTATSTANNGILLVALPTATATITLTNATINASGAFSATATATANGDLSLVPLPIGVVVTNSLASVDVGGTTVLAAGSVNLAASSNVNSNIPTESLAPANSAADGAVAVSTINSTAIARIGDTANVTATNAIDLTATNTVISVANATPQAAAFGASVGVSVVNSVTTAEITGAADLSAASLSLDASSSTDITVTAAAAAGGATEPTAGSKAATYLSGAEYGDEASTSEGKVSIVGALAISDLTSTTTSAYRSTTSGTVSGDLRVASSSQNSVVLTADGSAVNSKTGVGVAVGINIAKIKNDAIIFNAVTAGAVQLSALSDNGLSAKSGNAFSTTATSGAGASGVGVAGSLALNLIDTQSTATVGANVALTITGGAVSVTSDDETETTAEAKPADGGATGDTLGLGASVAINIVANRSKAEVADGATVAGASDLTLSATAVHAVTTAAEAGSSGGVSLTPVLALSMVNNTTTARLGTGSAQVNSGDVSVSAAQQSTTSTTAKADAAGAKAAIGASLALALVDDRVLATTDRNVTAATGAVTFNAYGGSSSTLESVASASGAAPADDAGDAPAGAPADVDTAVTSELTAGSTKQTSAGIGDADQQAATTAEVNDEDGHSASTSEGKITVAAGVSINVQNATVTAGVPNGVVITSGGALTLRTANNTIGEATASGSAVGVKDAKGKTPEPSKVGIGAAVAVNVVKSKNDATLGVAAHSVGGLTIEALSLDVAKLMASSASTDTKSDSYKASATAGAGAGKVSVAGSVAINLIDTQSVASIAENATVTVTSSGDVRLSADNQTETTAEALPVDGTGGGDVGIGASVALNIVANRSKAEVSNGATVDGAADLILSADAVHSVTTTAEAGSEGGVSITPVLALSMINNTTTARLGTGGTQTNSGNVTVTASQESTTTTKAKAAAAGAKAAIGASLALALVDDQVLATSQRNITTTTAAADVSLGAIGVSSSTLEAIASAAGAKEGDDADAAPTSTGNSVDKTATKEMTAGSGKQKTSGVGDTTQQNATTAEAGNESGRSAKTSEGKVSVAAAVAVNVQKSTVTAAVPDGISITSGGALTVASANNTNGSATSDGSAVAGADGGTSKVGIGVAVSVNVVTEKNTAYLGAGTHAAYGVNVTAMQGAAVPTDTFLAKATSGAGGTKVGIAGSLALNLINIETTAKISGAAIVNAGTGSSSLTAEEKMEATSTAAPSDQATSGGKVGIGASVGLNFITATTVAEVLNGATLTNGAGLTVEATSDITTVTEASAGAEGGIAVDASVALAMLDETTTARIGSGNALSMGAGAVVISASNTGANTATSKGENKSGKVGIGASAAVILGSGASDGVLDNTSLTTAHLNRGVTAGSLQITASSDRTYDSTATATAKGGEFDDADEKKNKTTGGTSTSATSMDKTKDSQRGSDGKSGGSKVTVAAAAGIAAAQDNVSATLGNVTVNVTGAVGVSATNKVGVATSGSGLAVNSASNIGVGIGVGLGIINNKTSALITTGATISNASAVTLAATSRENVDGAYLTKLTALGIAGASGKKVSVAGALAVGISTGESTAIVGDNVSISTAGAVSVTADNTSHLASKALAGSVSTGGTGIGASIAVVVSDKAYTASVGGGNTIASGGLTVKALSHKVDAGTTFTFSDLNALKTTLSTGQLLGANNYYVEAIGGSAGSKTSITGSFAVMTFTDDVKASVGQSLTGAATAATTVNAGAGDVTIEANNDFLAKALSGAIALSSGTGVGVAGSLIVSGGTTIAQLANKAIISNARLFTSRALASQDIQAFGVAVAFAGKNALNGVATVITAENQVEALMGAGARVTATGAVNLIADNSFSTFSLAGAAAGGGSNAIGASASVVVVNNVTRAAIADGTSAADRAEINTGDEITVSATAKEDGETIAAAGAAGGSNAVGAGAGVYVLNTTTEAVVGKFAKLGNAFNTGSVKVSASDVSTLMAIGGAAAGGGSAGAGAGVAISVIDKTTKAAIGQSALVRSANVVVDAANTEDLSAIAVGVGIGGSAGLAGAVSVYAVTTKTTANVGQSADIYSDGNVAVLASDNTGIDMLDGAIAGGGSAGIGASVGITVINATTLASVDDSAKVTALGNGTAQAYVTGYTPSFGAFTGTNSFQAADVNHATVAAAGAGADENDLRTSDDARKAGLKLLTENRLKTPVTAQGRGVIVNAVGTSAVRSMAVAGTAAGSVAVSLSASVPVITMDTKASVGSGVEINKVAGGAGDAQSLTVAAASDVYVLGFSGAVAIGGSVGGGAGVNAAVVDTKTRAIVGTSDVAAQGDVIVSSKASEDFAIWAIAGAGGGVAALAGSGSAVDLTTETTATLGGKVVAKGNVDVIADDITRTAMLAGSVAIGGTAGIGAAVGVVLVDKTITASIASGAQVTGFGNGTVNHSIYTGAGFDTARSTRGVNVEANSTQGALTLVVSGAGGLYAGIAGVLSLNLMDVTTSAFIGANAQVNTEGGNAGATTAQDVSVTARDSTVTSVAAGAVSAGLVGLSGAVDVGIFKTTTAAYVQDGARVNAGGDVFISGLSNKAGDSLVASGSGGAFALAAGIAIYSYGDGVAPGGEADKELDESSDGVANMDGVNSDAQDQANNSEVDNLLQDSDDSRVKKVSADAQAKRAGINVAGAAAALSVPAGTSASVGSATINAGKSVGVTSSDDMKIDLKTGAFAVGGAAVGAGIAVITVDTGSTAQINGAAATVTSASVNVNAGTEHSIKARTFAGAAGGLVALSADAAVIKDRSRTKAYVRAQNMGVTNGVAVKANASRAIDIVGLGVSIGGAAGVGASIATAEIGGVVDATIQNTKITSGSVSVLAKSDDDAVADATAAGGGVGIALQGAGTIATVSPTVSATIDNSDITAPGGAVDVRAEAIAKADTTATGFAVAGLLAAGGSLADSTVSAKVSATIKGGSTITAGSIDVSTNLNVVKVKAASSGSAGALVGLSATISNAKNTSSAIALVSGSKLKATGLVNIASTSTTNQEANASGLAVGLIAAGFNTSAAKSNTKTQAVLTDLVSLEAGALAIDANSTDTNKAVTVAGSGGLVAGSAASGTTETISSTLASADQTAGGYNMTVTGNTDISALHQTSFAGSVDSTQASLAGGSGAELYHTVLSDVDAHIGNNVNLYGANLKIAADNLTTNTFLPSGGWNVDSTSGGLASLPAGGATLNINHRKTNASIGQNALVHLMPIGGVTLSDLTMSAHSDITAQQKAKIDSGGAIALADVDILLDAFANTTVSVGDNSDVIVDKGDILMAAWGTANIDVRGSATTYGLAGAPTGEADVRYTGANSVTIGESVRLEASDGINPVDGSEPSSASINLSAGKDLDLANAAGKDVTGFNAKLAVNATLDIFNNTAIPIPASPDPTAFISNASNVIVKDSGATPQKGVSAAGDITISAHRGDITASAVGTGKDIYREVLAAIASAVSNAFGGGDVSFDYHGGTSRIAGSGTVKVDGLVNTGLQRFKTVQIKYAESDFQQAVYGTNYCVVATTACIADPTLTDNIKITITGEKPVGTQILNRLTELQNLLAAYDKDVIAAGAYANEIRFLQDKLVSLGLGSYTAGVFALGSYSGISEKDAAAQSAVIDTTNINTTNASFVTATDGVFGTAVSETAAEIVKSYTAGQAGIDSAANSLTSALNTVKTFSTYTVAVPGAAGAARDAALAYNAGNATRAAAITTLIQEGQTAANSVGNLKAANETAQTNIATQRGILLTQQSALAVAIEQGIPAAQTAAQLAIGTAKSAIDTNLGVIATNNTAMAAAATTAAAKAAAAKTSLDGFAATLETNAAAGAARDAITASIVTLNRSDTGVLANNGALAFARGAVTVLNEQKDALTRYVVSINDKVTALRASAPATVPLGSATSVAAFEKLLTGLNQSLGNNNFTASNGAGTVVGPTAPEIIVPDTVARLGNIFINADTLVGGATGKLAAPGDARILVENFTAASLVLNNLVIPTYDAANVRFNGALVNSAADINAMNKGVVLDAAFQVKTGLVSSRPMVEILSHYNPEDTAFHNTASGLQHLKGNYVGPDIILNTGSVLENTTGAVRIISDAGNIYIRGQINAGSVEIVAKNGDFVASYVNGFNHIGGDPAQFNLATRDSEAGPGILANGGISIAARYININSTIQSGIVNNVLNLTATPTLTTFAVGNIGLTDPQVTAAIAAYRASLVGVVAPSSTIALRNTAGQTINLVMPTGGINPTELKAAIDDYTLAITTNSAKDPIYSFDIGGGAFKQVNIKDWIDGSITGRLEFNKAQAEYYMDPANRSAGVANWTAVGDGIYQLVSDTSTIGANYNTADKVFEVNGTSVHGGYIQLYGQIMNTAKGSGALKVLDGFGTIDINNASGTAVVLKTLNTGSDVVSTMFNDQNTSQLRGTAGIIDITDVVSVVPTAAGKDTLTVNVKHSVYSRDYDPDAKTPAGQVRVAVIHGTIDPVTGRIINNATGTFETTADLTAAMANTGGNRDATYATTPNQRYVWTTAEKFKQVTTKTNSSSATFFNLVTYSTASFNTGSSTTSQGVGRLPDGTYVSPKNVTLSVTNKTIPSGAGVIVTESVSSEVANSTLSAVDLKEYEFSYITSDSGIYETGRRTTCSVACFISKTTYVDLQRDQFYTTITTHSLKADNPIAISFIGSDTGSITVDSVGDVIINSDFKSLGGDVNINVSGAGKSIIKGTDTGLITAQSVSLNASGSVGGLDYVNADTPVTSKAIFVNMTKLASGTAGTLNAIAGDGNVSVFGRGDLRVGQATAASSTYSRTTGNVELSALGSILAAGTASLVQGYKVTLSALSGSIGSKDDYNSLLHVNSGYTSDPANRPFGEAPQNVYMGLTAVAAGNIGIRSSEWAAGGNPDGTMLVNQVLSLGGDVTLASTGQILDNNPVETIDLRTYNQLLGYWDSLGLLEDSDSRTAVDADTGATYAVDGITSGNNHAKQAQTIRAYENIKTKQYKQYWAIRSTQADPTVFDPTFVVTLDPTSATYKSLSSSYTEQIWAAKDPTVTAAVDAGVQTLIQDYETTNSVVLDPLSAKYQDLSTQYKTQVRATLDPTVDGQVVAKIDAYNQVQTKEYRDLNDIVGGQQGNVFLTEYDASTFKFTATQTQRAEQETLYRNIYEADYRAGIEASVRAQVTAEFPEYTAAQLDAAVQGRVNNAATAELAKPSAGFFTGLQTFVKDYEAQQTTAIKASLTSNDGLANYFIADYKYTTSAAEMAELTAGSVWTERQLAFSLAPGALKTVTGTNPIIKDPNVSGRTVEIFAEMGVGETAAGTANPGVSIRSSLDPALLTADQKVALAAAERSDLLLTVGSVALPVAPPSTAKPAAIKKYDDAKAAFAEYQAAVAGLVIPLTVDIPLGAKFVDLTPIQQAFFNAAAAGLVAADKTVLTVLSKRPLNFNATEELSVTVTATPTGAIDSDIGKAFLASQTGALLGAISTIGETRIKVRDDIANSGGLGRVFSASPTKAIQAGGGFISTGNLILESAQGGIGSTTPLNLALKSGATTTARAQNGVSLVFAGDGLIDTVYSPQNVTLDALTGSLVNANGDKLINVLGSQVMLTAANGAIGTSANSLNVGVNLGGAIKANAKDGINLYGPLGFKFVIGEAKSTAGGTIDLFAADEGIVDGEIETAGNINLTAGGRQLITGNGAVTSGAGAVTIDAASLKMLNGVALTAAGKVQIDTVGNALVTGITSASALVDAVSITAGGQVFAGTLAGRLSDIRAMAAGAGVKILAGLGIGDKTQANDTAEGNTVTDTANPLRIMTNTLEAAATNGAIDVAALSDITLASVTANAGSIRVTGTGKMDITNATSGGSQTFVAQNDLTFTTLSTAGLGSDVGNIEVKSVAGLVGGGDIAANGSSVVSGNGVTFGTITAGADSTITSTLDITGNTQIAVGDVNDTAGSGGLPGSININTIRGRNMRLQATDQLNVGDLQVAEVLKLQADKVSAAVTQVPSGPDPLKLTLTGANGAVATTANLTVNAPAGIVMDELKVVDTTLTTTAKRVDIQSAFVPGALLLTSPIQTIKVDNRTPLPQSGSNVQVHVPEFAFGLTLDGNATTTNGIVVNYDVTANVTNILPSPLDGISLTRDTVRKFLQADDSRIQSFGSMTLTPTDETVLAELDGTIVVIDGVEYMVFVRGDGPAVLLRQSR